MTLSTLHPHLNLENVSLAFQNSYSEALHARLGKPQRKFCFAHQMFRDMNSRELFRYAARKVDTQGVQDPLKADLDHACWEGTETWHPASGCSPVHCAPFFIPVSTPNSSQAIRELQDEVSRLRLRLEDRLHQHPQGRPTRSASSCDRPTRARERSGDSSATWSSHYVR